MGVTRESLWWAFFVSPDSQFHIVGKGPQWQTCLPDFRESQVAELLRAFVRSGERTREMNIKSIEKGLTIVSLVPEDCQQLAKVCERALETLGPDDPPTELPLVEAMGAAFKAAALAALAQLGYEAA